MYDTNLQAMRLNCTLSELSFPKLSSFFKNEIRNELDLRSSQAEQEYDSDAGPANAMGLPQEGQER